MNLSDLHQRLSQKPTYRKAYDAIGDVVLIGAAVRKLREDVEVTQQELASKLEISQFYLSRLETGSGRVSPDVIATVVHYFEEELRGFGINVEPWLATTTKTAPLEKPLSQQRPIMPDSVSRTRRPTATKELSEGILHDRPHHKQGTPH
jgi:transcriptional regulator with XRE-family HTH domain